MVTVWIVVVVVALIVIIVSLWLWLRSASPQPPGQHRRPRRLDPHDPIREDGEEPPGDG